MCGMFYVMQYRLTDLAARDVHASLQHYKDLKIGSDNYSMFIMYCIHNGAYIFSFSSQ